MSGEGDAHSAGPAPPLDGNDSPIFTDNEVAHLNINNKLESLQSQGIIIKKYAPNMPSNDQGHLVNNTIIHDLTNKDDQLSQPKPLEQVQPTHKNYTFAKEKRKRKRLSNDSINGVGVERDPLDNNRFALLSDSEFEMETDNEEFAGNASAIGKSSTQASNGNRFSLLKNLFTPNNTKSTATPNDIRKKLPERVSTNNTKGRFCPPIILFNVNITSLVRQFKVKFPDVEIKIINKSNNKSKLFIRDFEAYKEMMLYLKEEKINSHSFTPMQCKQTHLIIRGLHQFMQSEDIKNELDLILPNYVDTVKEFTTPFMKANFIKSNLFLVTLLQGKSHLDLIKINNICYQKITWEKPKSYSNDVQCKNCQRWGHLAKNCNHAYQCMKCDTKHEPGQCSLNKSEEAQPYCSNCKKWGHPTNFRGCDVDRKYVNDKKKMMNSSNSKKISIVSNSVDEPSKSYASLFKKK